MTDKPEDIKSNEKILMTLSLVGTDAQHQKWQEDMAKIGWKLTFKGNSGTWIGEPIYEIRKDGTENGGV